MIRARDGREHHLFRCTSPRQASGRAIGMAEVEARAAREIERRLVVDRPANEIRARRCEDSVAKRKGS